MPDGCWDSAIPITMPCGYAADAVLAGPFWSGVAAGASANSRGA